MESQEHFEILIVGAEISGIDAASHLQAAFLRKTYSIMEAPEALGSLTLRECFTAHYHEALQPCFSHYNVSATVEIFAAPQAAHHSGGKISCAAEILPADGPQRLAWSTTAQA